MTENRRLEVTVVSAKDLKNVNHFKKTDVYTVVSIKEGDFYITLCQKTHVHRECGPDPTWNFTMEFIVDEAALQRDRLTLEFLIRSKLIDNVDGQIGYVHVPIKELLVGGMTGDGKEPKNASYSVRTVSGEAEGTLNISYKFGAKYNAPPPVEAKKAQGPAMAYPAAGYPGFSSAFPPPPPPPPLGGYAAPPPPGAYPYRLPGGYPPAPQYAYGGYQAPPPRGYGYPAYPPQPGCGVYPPVVQPQQPKQHALLNMGLEVGAKVLGEWMAEKLSDVGEKPAYDAPYDGLGDV